MIKILNLTRNRDTCMYYRIDVPWKYLDRSRYDLRVEEAMAPFFGQLETTEQFNKREKHFLDQRMSMIDWCDLLVLQRGTDDCHLRMIKHAKATGKKTIYECFTYDNEIMTDKGLQKIGDIVTNELPTRVFDAFGNTRDVEKFFWKDFDGWIYKIKPWYLGILECTDTHTFPARKFGFQDEVIDEIEAKHLRIGDFLKIPFMESKEEIPLFDLAQDVHSKIWIVGEKEIYSKHGYGKGVSRFIEINENTCRLFGYFLSEGCVDHFKDYAKTVTFSFNSNETEYHQDVQRLVKEVFGLECGVYDEAKYHANANGTRITIRSVIVANFFNRIFGIKARSHTKFIPQFFFNKDMPPEYLEALFRGIFRGDGCDGKANGQWRGARLTSASKTMVYQIHNLLLRFGIIGSIYKMWRSEKRTTIKGKPVKSKEGYELKISIVDDAETVCEKKPNTYKTRNKNLNGWVDRKNKCAWIKIRKITREKKAVRVFNVCVSESHTYNIRTIASHNSDDLYTNVPTWNPGYHYFMQRQTPIRKMLQTVDMLTVSTAELARYYQGFNKNIVVLPNSIDFEYFDSCAPDDKFPHIVDCSKVPARLVNDICSGKLGPAPAEIMEFVIPIREFHERVGDRRVVMWSGSPTHMKDIEQIVGAMKKLTHSKDFVFVLGGFVEAALFRESYRGNMFLIGLVPMHNYYKIYKAIGAEIVLAPVYPHPFNQCKSNLRILEAMAMGAIPIASKYVTYAEWINKGRLAQMNDSSWLREIEGSFSDFESGAAEGIIDDNDRYVREFFDARRNAELWMRAYESL